MEKFDQSNCIHYKLISGIGNHHGHGIEHGNSIWHDSRKRSLRFNDCSGGRRSLEIIPIVIRKNIKCSRNVSYVVHDTGMQRFVSLLHMLHLLVKKRKQRSRRPIITRSS